MGRLFPFLALMLVVGCALERDTNDASMDDAARFDAGADGSVSDAGPRSDADLVVHSRCASPPSTQAVAVSYGGACRVDDTGQLWCWGQNEWGQVRPGGGTWVEPHEVAYEGLSDVTSVASSGLHTCVVHRDGGVSCWGTNLSGELGVPSPMRIPRPTRVLGITDVDRLALAPGASCARTRDGRWWCWGGIGYLGAAFGVTGTPGPGPFEVPGLRDATQLAIGYTNAAVLLPDGRVQAISVPESRIAHPYVLRGIDDAIDVVSFESYVCVVRRSGRVWCAGEQTVAIDPAPYEIPGIDDARAFAHGSGFLEACVVRGDGSLWCWTLARTPVPPPWPVPGASDVDVAAIGSALCVTRCDGQVFCNGVGWRGENGDDVTRVPPAEIVGLTDAVAIDGDCALRGDGTVSCWDTERFVTYDPPCPPPAAPLEPRLGLDHVVRLEDGAAIRDDGSVACVDDPSRVLTGLPAGAADATCAYDVAFAITADGRLFDWITMGSVTTASQLATAAPVAELTSSAFRTTDGRVFPLECNDFFGLVCVIGSAWPGVSDADALWTAEGIDCVRHVGGRVDCRFTGAALTTVPPLLGIATPANLALVHVPLLDGATQIALDGAGLCARDAAGSVRCWGDGQGGRLGANLASVHQTMPVASGAIDLAAARSICALRDDGHVTCWGLVVGGWSSGALCPLPLDHAVHVP